jgi:hypothetical protein
VTDPISKTVSGVTGVCHSRFANPYPAVLIGLPSRMIYSASPGIG